MLRHTPCTLQPIFRRGALKAVLLACLLVLAGNQTARAQTTLLADEFSGTSLNTSLWGLADDGWTLHRTRFGLAPVFRMESSTSFARFNLNTHSPSGYDPNISDGISAYVQATQIYSKAQFKMGSGVEIETRMRGTKVTPGMVLAFFTFADQGYWPGSLRRDEIDFELLTNRPNNELWSHIWNDWNPNYGYDDGIHDLTTRPVVSGWNRTQWSTYKLRWLNDRVEIYVNNVLARTERAVLPDHPMGLYFNIWAADSSWPLAYNSALKTATTASANINYYMDVDYVRVRSIAPPANTTVGTGDGLAATYFSNPDLTGTTVSRIEPRVNFSWTPYFPDQTLGQGSYSARWSGQVQGPDSGLRRFHVQTNGGVRLWVNDRLVIDAWRMPAGTTEYLTSAEVQGSAKYNIRLEYFNSGTGNGIVKLLWSSNTSSGTVITPKQLVPQTHLYSAGASDTTAPSVAVLSPNADWSYYNFAQANGTASDADSGVQQVRGLLYRYSDNTYWNGSAWTASIAETPAQGTTNWTFNLPALTQGRYAFQAAASDYVGLTRYSPWVPFYIDRIAPTVTITSPTQSAQYSTIGAATGTAVDTGPGVAWVKGRLVRASDGYYWNGSGWTSAFTEVTCQGTGNWSYPLPALAPGQYSWQAVASDWVGNITYSAPVNFTKTP